MAAAVAEPVAPPRTVAPIAIDDDLFFLEDETTGSASVAATGIEFEGTVQLAISRRCAKCDTE